MDQGPALQGKPKVIVSDCCQGGGATDQSLPKEMIVARSARLGMQAFETPNVGNVYSSRLASKIRESGATDTVEDLLKLTQAAVSNLGWSDEGMPTLPPDRRTPTQQVAHVDQTLGAYHLYLGGAT